MKKTFTLISFVLFFVAAANAQLSYTLSPSTYSSSATVNTTNITYTFSNSVTVANNNTKAYGTGSITSPVTFSGIKYSAGTQYTITFPTSISVSSVSFYGYDNYTGKKSYFTEVNGTTTSAWNDSTQYFLTAKIPGTTPTAVMSTVTFTYDTPIKTNTFTYTPAGNQIVAAITVNYTTTTTGIENVTADLNKPTNVYAIDGRRIRTNVFRSLATEGLPSGLYIIDNKKVVVVKK